MNQSKTKHPNVLNIAQSQSQSESLFNLNEYENKNADFLLYDNKA